MRDIKQPLLFSSPQKERRIKRPRPLLSSKGEMPRAKPRDREVESTYCAILKSILFPNFGTDCTQNGEKDTVTSAISGRESKISLT